MNTLFDRLLFCTLLSLLVAACSCNPQCDPAVESCGGTTASIEVGNAAARGCELLLTQASGTRLERVTFEGEVKGAFVAEAPRTAVTFVSGSDAPLPPSSIKLVLAGPTSGLSVTRATCVDGKGVKLPEASISLR